MLALLRGGERYSYELVRALGDADGLVTTEGTLYPLLGRLRRDGVVDVARIAVRAAAPLLPPHPRWQGSA